ncbi:unnamed protein product [Adineta steineri]|uniref:Aldehyde dehydrogenase domain-containing protein n=1 Tax=Adineta steineri TaxID=433720 RepID=A0A818MSR3_9BILA|nr:unnamed protein product [Adineta steineri]CAF3594042.1 unnamed protein product [Adineta steineri]
MLLKFVARQVINYGFCLTKRAALMDAHQRLIVGEIIEAEATKMVKRTTLELNGKSTNTVHVEIALEVLHFALFFNQGQYCHDIMISFLFFSIDF